MTIIDLSLGLAAEQRHILWDEDADSAAHLTDPEYAHTVATPEGAAPVILTGSHAVSALPDEKVFQCPRYWCGVAVTIGDDESDAWAELWGHVHAAHNPRGMGATTDGIMYGVKALTLRELYG
jgi:hypothetical protein